ncbi:Glutamine synthetase [compost metagenome]
MLAAGLDGIERKLALPAPSEEDLYHMDGETRTERHVDALPGSLGEALDYMKQDEVVKQAMGEHLFNRFIQAKTQEWDEYRMQVTEWERQRYLAIY